VSAFRYVCGFFPRELQVEIDEIRAQLVWCKGKPIAVIDAWDIAKGRGWIEKADEWARKHRALLYDTESGFEEAVVTAFAGGYGMVVVRQFNVRD
jgi:hypothetical protein